MTFEELAKIAEKSPSAVRTAFSRKKWSISKPADVASYLHLAFRSRKIRQKQPTRSVTHLKKFQFKSDSRRLDTTLALKLFRQRYAADGWDADREKFARWAQWCLLSSTGVVGVTLAGEAIAKTNADEITVFVIYKNPAFRSQQAEKLKIQLASHAEAEGWQLKFFGIEVGQIGDIETDPVTRKLLTSGRVEYGWTTFLA